MPRNTRSTSDKRNQPMDRSRPREGTKMHGSRSNESDRETRMGAAKDANGGSRKSSPRTRPTSRTR